MIGWQHMQARHLELAAAALDGLDQLALDDGVEHDARRLLDLLQHALELLGRAHQRMHVLDGAHLRVLHRGGLRHRGQCLARGIRDQMQMEVAGAAGWACVDKEQTSQGCQAGAAFLPAGDAAFHKNGPQQDPPGQDLRPMPLHGDKWEAPAYGAAVNR